MNQYAVIEGAKRNFAGLIAQHTFSLGAPDCVPLDLLNDLLGRPATSDEFEQLCGLMLANFISLRDDGVVFENWYATSKGRRCPDAGDYSLIYRNMILVASVLEAQTGFVSADEFETMRQAFFSRFGKSWESLTKSVNSMRVEN